MEKLFAPSVLLEVRDVMFGGAIKRLIGSATIDLSQFMLDDEKHPGRWRVADKAHQETITSPEQMDRENREQALKKKVEEVCAFGDVNWGTNFRFAGESKGTGC